MPTANEQLLRGTKEAYQYLKANAPDFVYNERTFVRMVECGDVPEDCYKQRKKKNAWRYYVPSRLLSWWNEYFN